MPETSTSTRLHYCFQCGEVLFQFFEKRVETGGTVRLFQCSKDIDHMHWYHRGQSSVGVTFRTRNDLMGYLRVSRYNPGFTREEINFLLSYLEKQKNKETN